MKTVIKKSRYKPTGRPVGRPYDPNSAKSQALGLFNLMTQQKKSRREILVAMKNKLGVSPGTAGVYYNHARTLALEAAKKASSVIDGNAK